MRKLLSAMMAVAVLAGTVPRAGAQNIDNVVILLDASGSMNGMMGPVKKIDAAKSAMKEILKSLPPTTHVGLLVFSASNVKDWAYPLGPRDDQKLTAAIDLPQPYGGTPLGTYMKMAADRLLEARKAQFGYGTYRLLVVTDGEANNERKSMVDDYTRDIIARGITVDVVGVMMARTHTLATKVHSYRSADDPASLKNAIKEVFAEVAKPKDAAAEAEVFAEIAPLPGEVATAIINALSSSGNHPIGEKPVVVPPPGATPPSSPQPQKPVAASPATSAPPPKSGGSGSSWFAGAAVVIIAFLLFRGRAKR